MRKAKGQQPFGFSIHNRLTGVVMSDYIVVHGIRIAKDFTPETFGRWTTLGPKFWLPRGGKGEHISFQVCECSCGNASVVMCNSLKSGNTKSCGCFNRQRAAETHTKHGLSRAPEYDIWKDMKDRCGNPNNKRCQDYGGRGIRVCDRWLDPESGFANFYTDMGPRPSNKHSIERNSVNGDYCPENCRWATWSEQARNKRSNVMITYNWKTQCVAAWAEELGIPGKNICRRLKAGWTAEKALTTKVK